MTLVDTPEGRFNGRLRVCGAVSSCGVNLIRGRADDTVLPLFPCEGRGPSPAAAASAAWLVNRDIALWQNPLGNLSLWVMDPCLRRGTMMGFAQRRRVSRNRRRSRIASMARWSHTSPPVGKRYLIRFCSFLYPIPVRPELVEGPVLLLTWMHTQGCPFDEARPEPV